MTIYVFQQREVVLAFRKNYNRCPKEPTKGIHLQLLYTAYLVIRAIRTRAAQKSDVGYFADLFMQPSLLL